MNLIGQVYQDTRNINFNEKSIYLDKIILRFNTSRENTNSSPIIFTSAFILGGGLGHEPDVLDAVCNISIVLGLYATCIHAS